MRLIILSPDCTKFPLADILPSDVVFVTNPVEQRFQFHPTTQIITEQMIEDASDFKKLNSLAKQWSRTWFNDIKLRPALTYKGVNIGSLLSRELAYQWIMVLKIIYLIDRILLKVQPSRILLVGNPKNPWIKLSKIRLKKQNIPHESLGIPSKNKFVISFKNTIRQITSILLYPVSFWWSKPGKILFSSALKFAYPFLSRRKSGDYYVRDIFSFKSFCLGRKINFFHFFSPPCLLTLSFKSPQPTPNFDDSLENFFTLDGVSIWPFIREDFYYLLNRYFSYSKKTLRWLNQLLDKLKPKAVVLDEEVCFFNSALVNLAKEKGIKSYTLLHGMPFDDIGTCPSKCDKILTWGRSSSEQLKEWGIPEDHLISAGAPQYETLNSTNAKDMRLKIFQFLKISEQNQLIVFASQPFHTNRNSDFLGNPMSPETLSKALHILFETIKRSKNLILIIKCHPREDKIWFTENLVSDSGVSSKIHILKESDTTSLIAASDLLVTMGSTVFFEALLMKKLAIYFDQSDNRFFEKMGSNYLDLNDTEESIIEILRLLSDSQHAKLHLKQQEDAVKFHFAYSNDKSVDKILELFD